MIGEVIKHYRKKAKITQQQLGEHCDKEYYEISNYERGINQPSLQTLVKISLYLKIPMQCYSLDMDYQPYELALDDHTCSILNSKDRQHLRAYANHLKMLYDNQ